jgi:hypothetical protein
MIKDLELFDSLTLMAKQMPEATPADLHTAFHKTLDQTGNTLNCLQTSLYQWPVAYRQLCSTGREYDVDKPLPDQQATSPYTGNRRWPVPTRHND